MIAANPCQQRSPNDYLAESIEEVQNILNPRLGDLAIVTNEFGTSYFRLREPDDYVVDGVDVLESNRCEYVWVRSLDEDTGFDGSITSARINALIGAGRAVVIPEGTFEMDDFITLEGNVDIQGAGRGRTILDFSSAGIGNALDGTGALVVMPSIDSNIALGDTSITFAAAHNLSVNDVFVLENTTDFSFSSHRDIYHDGEWFEVSKVVSPTVVEITQPAYSSYTVGANISVWKVNPISLRLRGVTMRFRQGLGSNNSGLAIHLGRNIVVEDCEFSGSQYTGLWADRCFDVRVENCHFFDNQPTIGNNYGFAAANSQCVRVISCTGQTERHVIAFGGGTADGAVPCRDIQIIGGHYPSLGTSWAVDFHGNCEHYTLTGVNASGGVGLGGDHGTITGGRYGNYNANSQSIIAAELRGFNFNIDGVTVEAFKTFNNLVQFTVTQHITKKSQLDIKGIKIEMGGFSAPLYPSNIAAGIQITGTAAPANDDITINIQGGSVSTDQAVAGPTYAVYYFATAAIAVRNINISGLNSPKAGILMYRNAHRVNIKNCIIPEALEYGIRIRDVVTPLYDKQVWMLNGNVVTEATLAGVHITGDMTTWDIFFENNTVINNGQGTSSYGVVLDGARLAHFINNRFGDIQVAPTQTGTYSANNVSVFAPIRNTNLGAQLNALTFAHGGGIVTLRDDSPIEGPQWNYTAKGFEWGVNGASDTLPYLFRRDRNAFVQWQFQNKMAAGNPGTGVGLTLVGGEVGNSSTVSVFALAQDAGFNYQGFGGLLAASDADGIALVASDANQAVDIYAGNTARAARFLMASSAGHLSINTYDFDSDENRQLKAGANGTGPGGVGRAVYVDDI